MYAEKDFKIRVSPALAGGARVSVYTALAFGASVRVLFSLKNELTRETLISG